MLTLRLRQVSADIDPENVASMGLWRTNWASQKLAPLCTLGDRSHTATG
jgi:hypothetical protein